MEATQEVVRAFKSGPHIFNLGHGITPDADPENVALMIETVRKAKPRACAPKRHSHR